MPAPIYQLSDFQNESLLRLANLEQQLLVVMESAEDDDLEVKERFESQKSQAEDLCVLGLLENKTKKFVEDIAAHKLTVGRGYYIYIITEIGFDMFHGPRKRTIN